MSFRRRNVAVSSSKSSLILSKNTEKRLIPGTRPSPIDGRLTISTGTRSLDALLAGHGGLVLGASLLIEESGTTDFGGALLRHFAAEGIVQGHYVHGLGMNEGWGRELPGVTDAIEASSVRDDTSMRGDKMKIAWRYERLGEFGRDKGPLPHSAAKQDDSVKQSIFCHDFDLSKRLILPSSSLLTCVPLPPRNDINFKPIEASESVFGRFLQHLSSQLLTTSPSTIHRVVIPSLLSPAIYPHTACNPEQVLQFLHSLRALLRKYPFQLSVLITLPLSLHPCMTGLTRWIEILCDGVLELTPFPSQLHLAPVVPHESINGHHETPQGMLRIHRLPILHEKGGSGAGASGDDLAFRLSRKRGLVIRPFSLPPVTGDSEIHQVEAEDDHRVSSKADIDF